MECFPLNQCAFQAIILKVGWQNGRQLSQKRAALARSLQFSGASSSGRLPLKKWSNNNNEKHTPTNKAQ
jgi:hypothetical protein